MILRMKNKRRVARHTHTLLMEELAEVVYKLLKKDTGKFFISLIDLRLILFE